MNTRELWRAIKKPRFGFLDVLVVALVLGLVPWYLTTRHFITKYTAQFAAAMTVSPMPDVRLAVPELVPTDIDFAKKYDFTTDWFNHNIPIWKSILSPYQGKPDVRYLEIGTFEGRSLVWMLETILTHPTSRATAIDIFDGPYKEKYDENIRRTGSADRVTTMVATSQVAMRTLPLESYDIIYIDGSHEQADVLEDAVLAFRLLKKGGLLVFDDYRWAGFATVGTNDKPTDFPKTAIDRFYECFRNRLDVVHRDYQVVLRKSD